MAFTGRMFLPSCLSLRPDNNDKLVYSPMPSNEGDPSLKPQWFKGDVKHGGSIYYIQTEFINPFHAMQNKCSGQSCEMYNNVCILGRFPHTPDLVLI